MNTNKQNEKTTGANNSPVDCAKQADIDARWNKYVEARATVLRSYDLEKWNHTEETEAALEALAKANDTDATIVCDLIEHLASSGLSAYQIGSIAGVAAAWAYSKGRNEMRGLREPGPTMH